MKKIISWLLYALIFLLPLQTRLIVAPGSLNGQYFEYGTISLYATEILLGLIIALTIFVFLKKLFTKPLIITDKKNQAKRLAIFAIIFTFFLLNCFLAINAEIAFNKLTAIILAVAFFFLILVSELNFKKISYALVLSGTLQSVIALQQFASQRVIGNKWLGMANQDPNTLGTPVVLTSAGRFLRAFGTLPHPNILAGFLVITLIFLIGLYIDNQSKKQIRFLQLAFIVNVIGLLTAISRNAIIAFVISLVLLLFFFRKNVFITKKITKLAIISVFIIVLFAISYPEQLLSRTFSTNRIEEISNSERLTQYSDARLIFKSHWLIGTGIGNYTLGVAELKPGLPAYQYQPIHNAYLLIITELGLAGIFLIGFFFYWLGKRLRKLDNDNPTQTICFVSLATLAFLSLFDHYLASFFSGLLLTALILALAIKNWELVTSNW